ncbi:transposase [Streptococcus pneumoniae]
MDRGYESYNLMAHFQEKGWLYIIRIRDGKQSMPFLLQLAKYGVF